MISCDEEEGEGGDCWEAGSGNMGWAGRRALAFCFMFAVLFAIPILLGMELPLFACMVCPSLLPPPNTDP